ncbi:MAG: glycosyltransferase family 4 protein [Bacteroidales bacterium]|nr:glycosyltransferase family 4 protein [Bacteroidales bacterium]
MKRILCFIDSLGSGGAQRQMTELAKLLHQDGYPVKVVFWIHYDNDHFLEDELAQSSVDFAYVPSLRKTSTRLFELRKVIKGYKPDVVISYYSGISKLLCIDHLMHQKAYKLIVSERSITTSIPRDVKVKHQLYRFADVIVPNSTTESNFIREHFPFLKDKVVTINNFVDERKFYPLEKTVADFETTDAIFVGRYNEAKNIPNFIRSVAEVAQTGRKFHVDFFGRDIAEHCDALVEELGITEFVRFCSQSNTIEEEYRKHNLMIIPSLWEGFPNVLCEAMCCGLPALGSRVSDIPYIMQDGKNGFIFNPTDVDDMAEKMNKYLDLNAKEKQEMAEYSIRLSQDNFKKTYFLNKYVEIIQ